MDINDFEKEWMALGVVICHSIYKNPRIVELYDSLKKNGFLTLEEKSDFINISDKTKYEIIYAKYGAEGSEGYKKFSDAWQKWFQEKGVSSSQNRGQRNSVDHILFGSTPDPVEFLTNFESEVLNNK
jgi:hypothetical protein